MIDFDELYALADKARNNPCGHPINQVVDNLDSFTAQIRPSVVIELITRLRQAEKDAVRYRWLRGMRGGPLVVSCDIAGVPEVDKDGDLNFIWGDSLDTEIDEAMNGSNN